MKRRDFLRLSAAAGLAAVTRGLRALPWSRREPDFQLSVAHAAEWESGVFADAHALIGGDPAFLSRDAEVRVYGSSGPLSVEFDALYSVDGNVLRFHASGSRSVPVRFTMPVDAVDGLRFELRVSAAKPVTIPLRFSVNSAAGVVPLRRGRYVVALHERASPPDWSALEVTEGGIAGEFAASALLLEFDYAQDGSTGR
ncbi:MAG TPA: hypothetical protein VNA04_17040 [Thermoanaerobaculia bacterium]|nr:hypothetical protein [Thermoanaerobaculia bacterium]